MVLINFRMPALAIKNTFKDTCEDILPMKTATYFKILVKLLQKSICLSCFLRKLGLYDCLVDFPCLFPELLTSINQIQQRILKCITLSHILCQYESKLRSAPFKQVGSVAATRQHKVTVLCCSPLFL